VGEGSDPGGSVEGKAGGQGDQGDWGAGGVQTLVLGRPICRGANSGGGTPQAGNYVGGALRTYIYN